MRAYYAIFGLAFEVIGLDCCLMVVMIERKVVAHLLPGKVVGGERVCGGKEIVFQAASSLDTLGAGFVGD